ncbi:MAG: phosphoribosylanthranilate isomerase [Candidatus Binatia bacterium]
MSVRVKICGVCSVPDARAAIDAGADFLGLNFHPASPRSVSIERAREIAAAASVVPLVGVFVDAPRSEVETVADAVGLALLQFHGREDRAYCRDWRWRTIKALRPRAGDDVAALAAGWPTDYILLDSYVPGMPGGTGVPLDLAVARGLERARLFLAGGLTPETVATAVATVRPFAVDVASGVECRPGEKDHGKVREFVRRAKSA